MVYLSLNFKPGIIILNYYEGNIANWTTSLWSTNNLILTKNIQNLLQKGFLFNNPLRSFYLLIKISTMRENNFFHPSKLINVKIGKRVHKNWQGAAKCNPSTNQYLITKWAVSNFQMRLVWRKLNNIKTFISKGQTDGGTKWGHNAFF